MTTKRGFRCRLGLHAWARIGSSWSCRRCAKPVPACSNCGRQHDPNVITICTVRS